jgi:hypothetical protein
MSLQISFRVVGIFCYFENLQLENLSPTSTVKEVMLAISQAKSDFSFKAGPTNSGKEIVDTLGYAFSDLSTTPYNTSRRPANGFRDMSVQLGNTSLVWQYYRSVTGTIDGATCEIKLITNGQPSFALLQLNDFDPFFGSIPSNFKIDTYNLTWRLVQIQLAPESVASFANAKNNLSSY